MTAHRSICFVKKRARYPMAFDVVRPGVAVRPGMVRGKSATEACNHSVAETQPALNIKDAWLVARCAGARLRDHRDDRVDHYLRPNLLDRMCGARNSGVDAARRQGGQLVVAEIDHFDGLR